MLADISVDKTDPDNFVIDVKIPAVVVDAESDLVAKKLQPVVNINGFRKGSAPLDAIKRQYSSLIRGEVSTRLIQTNTAEALRKNGLTDSGAPVLLDEYRPTETRKWPGKFGLDGSFCFKVSVEPPPALDPQGYMGMELTMNSNRIKDWVKTQLSAHQSEFASTEIVQRPSQQDDVVAVRITALENDTPISGGEFPRIPVRLSANSINPISPQLPTQCESRSPGDTFSFSEIVADSHQDSHLRGKTVTFNCEVLQVLSQKPHPLDDDLAKKAGFDSLDAMTKNYEVEWDKRFRKTFKGEMVKQIGDKLRESNPFRMPYTWLDREIKNTLSRVGMDPEKGMNDPEVMAAISPIAEANIRNSYILDKIYENEPGLALTPEDVNHYADEECKYNGWTAQVYMDNLRKNNQYDGFIAQCQQLKVIDFIMAEAKIVESSDV